MGFWVANKTEAQPRNGDRMQPRTQVLGNRKNQDHAPEVRNWEHAGPTGFKSSGESNLTG
jgi:hypothetical protein